MSLTIDDFQSWYFAHQIKDTPGYSEVFVGVTNKPIQNTVSSVSMYMQSSTFNSYAVSVFSIDDLDDFITALQYARKVATENE